MKTLLWIGDANCDSGFAKCTHYTLEVLRRYYRVVVLGINHPGGPHKYPYDIHPCISAAGGDVLGLKRVGAIMRLERPDIIVLQNDPWNVPAYMKAIGDVKDVPRPIVVGAIAIDGKRALGTALNGLDHAIFWTKFAHMEALKGGYKKGANVIGLGVDRDIYNAGDHTQREYRAALGLPDECANAFIVGNVNRNQPRKRLDLTIQYFAEWIHSREIKDAYLFLHVAPTGDMGFNVEAIAEECGLINPLRLILSQPNVFRGTSEKGMAQIFRSFDVQLHTGMGEGWGLPTLEAMACGVTTIASDWAALGEWARPAALLAPGEECYSLGPITVRGAVPRKDAVLNFLDQMYRSPEARAQMRAKSLDLAADAQFTWENIGTAWADALQAQLKEY